ncbi:MAG: TIM barrel protein [Armatimonadota bacterium]|nr:TIM barrel protein [Armatimonadota bacterium]
MRLGTCIPFDDSARINGKFDMDKALELLREGGIRGCLHNFVSDESQWQSAAKEFEKSLRAANMTLLEYNAPFFIYTPAREDCPATAEKIVRLLAIAESIGCLNFSTCVAGPKSISPHPWNRSRECKDTLLRTCALVAEGAARQGLRARLLLEPVYTTIIRTPLELREVIDEIGSPNVQAHMDMVNMLSFDNIFDHADFMRDAFQTLGGCIHSAHVKDAVPMDSYLPGIRELPAGDGIVNLKTYLECLARQDPDFPVLVEHLKEMADIERCYKHVAGIARELGIDIWSN